MTLLIYYDAPPVFKFQGHTICGSLDHKVSACVCVCTCVQVRCKNPIVFKVSLIKGNILILSSSLILSKLRL